MQYAVFYDSHTGDPVGMAFFGGSFWKLEWLIDPLVGNEQSAFVHLIDNKIRSWVREKLPYRDEIVPPTSPEFWDHVRLLLIHRIKLHETRDLLQLLAPVYQKDTV